MATREITRDAQGRIIHQATETERRAVQEAAASRGVKTHVRDDRESRRLRKERLAKAATLLQEQDPSRMSVS